MDYVDCRCFFRFNWTIIQYFETLCFCLFASGKSRYEDFAQGAPSLSTSGAPEDVSSDDELLSPDDKAWLDVVSQRSEIYERIPFTSDWSHASHRVGGVSLSRPCVSYSGSSICLIGPRLLSNVSKASSSLQVLASYITDLRTSFHAVLYSSYLHTQQDLSRSWTFGLDNCWTNCFFLGRIMLDWRGFYISPFMF